MDSPTRDLFFLSCLGMTAREREVMVDRYLLERQRKDIARSMGVSVTRVYELEQAARCRLRPFLEEAMA